MSVTRCSAVKAVLVLFQFTAFVCTSSAVFLNAFVQFCKMKFVELKMLILHEFLRHQAFGGMEKKQVVQL